MLIAFGGDGAQPILWPEHFDIAIELGEATYGVSPGDDAHTEPYAYVSSDAARRPFQTGPRTFWNAEGSTGAERPGRTTPTSLAACYRVGHDARRFL